MNTVRKPLAFLGLILCLTGARALAVPFNYSYSFGDGAIVTGSFDGTLNGDYVDNISNVTLVFDGTPTTGPIFTARNDGAAWLNGPIVSFHALQNDFIFVNDDIANGGAGYNSFFWMIGASFDYGDAAFAEFDPLSIFSGDFPMQPDNWSLSQVPTASVPDAVPTVALLVGGLAGLALFFGADRDRPLLGAEARVVSENLIANRIR